MNDLGWIEADWPAPENIRAGVTTRAGGFSQGPYASLNLGAHVGDDPQRVARNRRRLREGLQLPAEPLWLNQVHGSGAVDADSAAAGATADGAYTTQAGTVCAVQTADCLPVLLCDDGGGWLAAAHAGWRGLAAGVLESVVECSPAAPARLMAWLGPAIGPRRFEVGPEVRTQFTAVSPQAAGAFLPCAGGRWLADLYLLARQRLAAAGVERVYGGGWCTHQQEAQFFSYRRDGVTGRMAALVWRQL